MGVEMVLAVVTAVLALLVLAAALVLRPEDLSETGAGSRRLQELRRAQRATSQGPPDQRGRGRIRSDASRTSRSGPQPGPLAPAVRSARQAVRDARTPTVRPPTPVAQVQQAATRRPHRS